MISAKRLLLDGEAPPSGGDEVISAKRLLLDGEAVASATDEVISVIRLLLDGEAVASATDEVIPDHLKFIVNNGGSKPPPYDANFSKENYI